jgi:hypothetical protein
VSLEELLGLALLLKYQVVGAEPEEKEWARLLAGWRRSFIHLVFMSFGIF